MPSLQPRLNVKVSQRQVLTPGLVQMVNLLALNKLELKEMVQAEMIENPVLEEVDETVPILDHIAAAAETPVDERKEPEPFDEIDFGSYFEEYLDPGFRGGPSTVEFAEDKPSFENFLSSRGTLTDHLLWQLGSLKLTPECRRAAELIVGNLDNAGYLTASDDDLMDALRLEWTPDGLDSNGKPNGPTTATASHLRGTLKKALDLVQHLDPAGVAARTLSECLLIQLKSLHTQQHEASRRRANYEAEQATANHHDAGDAVELHEDGVDADAAEAAATRANDASLEEEFSGEEIFRVAELILCDHLQLLQKRDTRELSRATSAKAEVVQHSIELIRTLDPRPGQRYNADDVRLIEPDVAFVKRDDEWLVVMNEEDMPSLRLSRAYRRMLSSKTTEKDVREYVKERYKSAIQLMRSIDQRKNTILRTCEAIVRRQIGFLESGVDAMLPMMIKDVAEEIGVHPSTVSRAVSNKYVHTQQGVFELRFFFSEGVAGSEGSTTPLMLLKRKVKKMIDDEDPQRPLTDEQIAHMLQGQGIDVTRRTIAKYREDLHIPSTHQRRVRA